MGKAQQCSTKKFKALYPNYFGSASRILSRYSTLMGPKQRSILKATRKKQYKLKKDCISELPDDILVSILSLLTMKEAAITSVLSRRWRKVWRYIPSLKFDTINKFGCYNYKHLIINNMRSKRLEFVNWVNGVLRQHEASNIDEFRISFPMNQAAASDITKCVSFAIGKKVRSLELKLSHHFSVGIKSWHYNFPPYNLTDEMVSSVKHLSLGTCMLHSLGIESFKSLITLSLTSVILTDDFMEIFLLNCALLEHLFICTAKKLVNLKVVGTSLQLKRLEIYCCDDLKNIEISATNLLSFKYDGPEISLSLERVPHLVEVSFGINTYDISNGDDKLTYVVNKLVNNFFQLETLILNYDTCEAVTILNTIPTLAKLKVLVLLVKASFSGYIGFSSLLKACPFLHRFELHLSFRSDTYEMRSHEVRMASKFHHQYLKEVVLSGFRGQQYDMDLAVYLIKTAVALEKITVDPFEKYMSVDKWVCRDHPEDKTAWAARKSAKRLYTELPPMAELVIL